jgi:hypothetical protein
MNIDGTDRATALREIIYVREGLYKNIHGLGNNFCMPGYWVQNQKDLPTKYMSGLH